MDQIIQSEFIIYVKDQARSAEFYSNIFRSSPVLDVPGITEFKLGENVTFGIMSNDSISRIIHPILYHPALGNDIPRCEIYLTVQDVQLEFQNAIDAGAKLISQPVQRDWGDEVCYVSDPDGHVIAFAQKLKT